jgi:hypothetical protein
MGPLFPLPSFSPLFFSCSFHLLLPSLAFIPLWHPYPSVDPSLIWNLSLIWHPFSLCGTHSREMACEEPNPQGTQATGPNPQGTQATGPNPQEPKPQGTQPTWNPSHKAPSLVPCRL